jgi:hypothetical protein
VFLRELNKNFDQEKKRHNYKSQNEEMWKGWDESNKIHAKGRIQILASFQNGS